MTGKKLETNNPLKELKLTEVPKEENPLRDIARILVAGHLANKLKEETSTVLVVAEIRNLIAGAGVLDMLEEERKEQHIQKLLKAGMKPDLLKTEKPLGHLSQIVTLPAWRGQGIGTALTRWRINHAWRKGAELIVGESWVNSKQNSETTLARNGLKPAAKLEKYYATEENSYKKNSNRLEPRCPNCLKSCQCDAVVYIIRRT